MEEKTNILVTGGAGNVGSALVEELIRDSNNYVVVVDNLQTGSRNKLPETVNNNLKFYWNKAKEIEEESLKSPSSQNSTESSINILNIWQNMNISL